MSARAGAESEELAPPSDLDEAEADKLLLTLDPLAAMAEADGERIKSLLETVQTDDKAVEALLRRTAGDSIWRLLHSQMELPAQVDKARRAAREMANGVRPALAYRRASAVMWRFH